MKSITILLNTTDAVKDFVQKTVKYDFDIDLKSGKYIVDAKSILGIFSLDLNKPVILEVYAKDCDALIEDIKPYIVD